MAWRAQWIDGVMGSSPWCKTWTLPRLGFPAVPSNWAYECVFVMSGSMHSYTGTPPPTPPPPPPPSFPSLHSHSALPLLVTLCLILYHQCTAAQHWRKPVESHLLQSLTHTPTHKHAHGVIYGCAGRQWFKGKRLVQHMLNTKRLWHFQIEDMVSHTTVWLR